MAIASCILVRVSSRVAPVATHPGKSGEYKVVGWVTRNRHAVQFEGMPELSVTPSRCHEAPAVVLDQSDDRAHAAPLVCPDRKLRWATPPLRPHLQFLWTVFAGR